jgi:succinate dehydrogenase hydrophobic anchor subunit
MKETRLKTLQYLTAIGLFFVVGIHLVVSHFTGEEAITWESVMARATSGPWFALYILALVFGLYHGLHGVRTVILEFSMPNSAVKVLDIILVAGGVAVLGYAVYIPASAF